MLATQQEIDDLASRIETAYTRKGVRWDQGRSTARVWSAAAQILWQCRIEAPEAPLDPELFVAAQKIDVHSADPWIDLASPRAGQAYLKRIRGIIRQLRTELHREIELAEELLRGGKPVAEVVCRKNAKLSPLCRYIVALRALRRDLADSWGRDARLQHESCPLYRFACLGLLPADAYPSPGATPAEPTPPALRSYPHAASLN